MGLKAQAARSTARGGPLQGRGQKMPGDFPGRTKSTTNPAMQTQGVEDPLYGFTTQIETGESAPEIAPRRSNIRGAVADLARRPAPTPSNAARKGGKLGYKTDSGDY